MKNLPRLREWWQAFFDLLFPRCCVVCGRPLGKGEEGICTSCNIALPRTGYHLLEDNPVEQLFWGKVSLQRATSFFYYRKGSPSRRILHQLKYGGQKTLAQSMGRYMAAELVASGFFEGVEVLIPVPLHLRKEKRRGYNQSEWIARGIGQVTGIPLDRSSVVRKKYTETQTRKTAYERWENVAGVFALSCPEHFVGKHILLIDDVLTTGATIVACASALQEVAGIRISVLTLAVAEG